MLEIIKSVYETIYTRVNIKHSREASAGGHIILLFLFCVQPKHCLRRWSKHPHFFQYIHKYAAVPLDQILFSRLLSNGELIADQAVKRGTLTSFTPSARNNQIRSRSLSI